MKIIFIIFYLFCISITLYSEMNKDMSLNIKDLPQVNTSEFNLELKHSEKLDINTIIDLSKEGSFDIDAKELYFVDSILINFSYIVNAKQLFSLNIWNCIIDDVSIISNMNNLEELRINFSKIVDLSFIKPLNSLRKLELVSNNIVDITPISYLPNLEVLDLSVNKITDISSIKELKKLCSLNVMFNYIDDFSILKCLPELFSIIIFPQEAQWLQWLGERKVD